MELPAEKAFFLTSRGSRDQYFCLLDSDDNQFKYKKNLYYPTIFETMSGAQIHRYQQKFILRFIYWGIRNKKSFQDPWDHRIILSRAFDLNFHILICVLAGISLHKCLSYIKSPFLDLMLEGTKVSASGIKKTVVFGMVGFGAYRSVKALMETTYLYDLAMKYKENFAKNELVSPNCEELYKKFLMNK